MGNIQAESGFSSINLEQIYEQKFGLNDRQYVENIDAGARDFLDSAGFGLCQWTFGPRKRALLQFARERGVSIGDLDMQIDFMIYELKKDFAGVWQCLTSTHSVTTASDLVMCIYENPADQSYKAMSYRQELGMKILQKYFDVPVVEEPEVVYVMRSISVPELCQGVSCHAVKILQAALCSHGFNVDVDGIFGANTCNALKAFQDSVGLIADGICGALTWTKLING